MIRSHGVVLAANVVVEVLEWDGLEVRCRSPAERRHFVPAPRSIAQFNK